MRAFNLLPEERRAETRHFQTKPVHLVLGALIPIAFVAVGLMYFTTDAAKGDKQAERDEISARLTALRAQLDEGDAPAADTLASQALAVGTAQWTSTVATALSERVSWDRVLQDADRVLPPNTYFETLAAAPGSGTPVASGAESTTTTTTDTTTAETAGAGLSRLTITGFAPDHETVAIYLRRVQTLRDVESASLTSTARAGTLGVLRFIIEAEVRPSR
jgi:Tfp pilus assembly protein PilN